MKYGVFFSLIAASLTALAIFQGGWFCLICWPAISFAVVAAGYFGLGPRVFGKRASGLLAPANQLLLLPFLLYVWMVWSLLRWFDREPAWVQLTDKISIGRRLRSHEVAAKFDHVIDLTCEFAEPAVLRSHAYYSFPILDGSVPASGQLRGWVVQAAGLSGDVYIHCAEGHGRTGLFAAALLLQIDHSQTPAEALQFINSKRPRVRLSRQQLATLHAIHNTG